MVIRLLALSDFGKPGDLIDVPANIAMRYVITDRAELIEVHETIANRDQSKKTIVKRKGAGRGDT